MTLGSIVVDLFGQFWNIYPRKVSVKSAREAWAIAITKASPESIIEAATRLSNDPNLDLTYTPAPARWLTEERWHDGALPPRKITAVEAQEREQRVAKERDKAERLRSAELAQEAEIARQNAVPIPPELKAELLAKWAQSAYPKP
jgi:hypothetical protein